MGISQSFKKKKKKDFQKQSIPCKDCRAHEEEQAKQAREIEQQENAQTLEVSSLTFR